MRPVTTAAAAAAAVWSLVLGVADRDEFHANQIVWPVWVLWACCSFVYIWLDYGWTTSMVGTLRRKMAVDRIGAAKKADG